MSRFLPITLFATLALFLAIGLSRDPARIPSVMIDQPMPAFSLASLDDPALSLTGDDLSGRIVLMNVFGSWCAACLQEHATLMRLSEEDSFILVGLNWRDDRQAALSWLDKYGNPYDLILSDPDSDLAMELGVTGAPETFLLDGQSRIRYKHTGPLDLTLWYQKLEPVITELSTQDGPSKP